jgi:Tol biopolymer transport system component
VTPGRAAGPAFSPDGRWLAYAAPACLGGPGVYRVRATAPHGAPQVLFPAVCREQAVPAPVPPAEPGAGALAERLRYDDAIAWSPDGTKIVFREGDCASVYDNCLSIGTVASGAERALAGFGGGGSEDGFAVVPAFSLDGTKVAWTAYAGAAVHVIEAAADGSALRQVGVAEDRELTYVGAGRALVTARHKGRSWVMLVNLATGKRTPFHAGSQPSY